MSILDMIVRMICIKMQLTNMHTCRRNCFGEGKLKRAKMLLKEHLIMMLAIYYDQWGEATLTLLGYRDDTGH